MKILVHTSGESTRDSGEIALAGRRLGSLVPGLTARLREFGVCYVRMEYSGEANQGGFVHMEFIRADGSGVRPMDPSVHATTLQAIFGHVLCFRYRTWAEGDGSTGDFRWDLTTDSLTHTHYVRGPNGNERATLHDL